MKEISLKIAAFCILCLACSAAAETPHGMKWIPPGEFTIGTDDTNSMPNERPSYRVKLDGFWIDSHLVSNAEFEKFVKTTKYVTTAEKPVDWEEMKKQLPEGTEKPADELLAPGSLVFTPPRHPVDLRDLAAWWTWTTGASWKHPQGPGSTISDKDAYPVIQVSWDDAEAYCHSQKKRLPTEAEWEYASRGGSKTSSRFWWGDEFRPGGKWMANTFTGNFPHENSSADGYERTSPVTAFPSNNYGLHDMAGNVWQWTSDLYREDARKLSVDELSKSGLSCHTNPKGPSESLNRARPVAHSIERVIKGGSFLCNVSYCESYRPSARRGMPPDTSSEHLGFRCVKDGV